MCFASSFLKNPKNNLEIFLSNPRIYLLLGDLFLQVIFELSLQIKVLKSILPLANSTTDCGCLNT